MADQEPTQEEILMSMHLAVSAGIDHLFSVAFDAYSNKIEDQESIYRLFIGILAQTIGRHIAAFPESERVLIENEALLLQEESTNITVREMAKRSNDDLTKSTTSQNYDLRTLKPMGNA